MNSLDRKLATTLKAALRKSRDASTVGRLSNEFRQNLERVINDDLRSAIETLFSKIARQTNGTTQPEAAEALRLLRTLLERGFRETPSVAFLVWLDLFSGLKLDEVLSATPNTVCFGKWLKKSKVPAQEIQRQLAERLDQIYTTIGADSLLEHAKPEMSLLLVRKFLSRESRPEYTRNLFQNRLPVLKLADVREATRTAVSAADEDIAHENC